MNNIDLRRPSLSGPPHGLQSLWGFIMKSFRAAEFVKLGQIAGITWAVSRLDNLSHEETGHEKEVLFSFEQGIASLESEFIELELTTSLATLRKMQRAIKVDGQSHAAKLRSLLPLQEELQGRLIDEMEGKLFWNLNIKEAEWYKNPRKGWEAIIGHFPATVTDIEEASKCFALSRYAAAVFHSVQVVEFGLIELGKLIGVTDPLPGWTATTSRLQNIIKKGHEARTPFERQHFAFLEQMHGTIEGLKNAWRNKISHAHGKLTLLTTDFSPDIAEEILFATRAFMRRLATDSPVVSGG